MYTDFNSFHLVSTLTVWPGLKDERLLVMMGVSLLMPDNTGIKPLDVTRPALK